MATHNQTMLRKPLPFGTRLSTRQDIDLKVFLTYLNQYMLAENEMDVQQNKRKVIDLECRKASSDPSLLEGVPNETLEMNLQYPFKSKHTKDNTLM